MADGPKIIHGITRGCNLRMNHIGDNLYRVVMLQQYRVITQTEQTEPVFRIEFVIVNLGLLMRMRGKPRPLSGIVDILAKHNIGFR